MDNMGYDLKNKKILVTGGSGSIGTYLIEMLDESNEILNIDICPPDLNIKRKIEFQKVNIINRKHVNKIFSEFKPQILFHLAAVFQRTIETFDFRNLCFDVNLVGMQNVFESSINNSVEQIVFASSYLIYDETQYLFEKNQIDNTPVALTENSPINPRNLTGIAKLYGERELEFYKELDIKTSSLRIFRVYGPKNVDVIDRWIRSIVNNETITYYGKEQTFDFVHARDVALGCLKAAIHKTEGVINIGSGTPTKIQTILEVLKAEFKDRVKMVEKGPKGFVKYEKSYATISKAKKMLNYKPELSIEHGIKLNIREIKKNLS